MSLHRREGEKLSRHSTLRSAWVYTPIEHFATEDIWTYLLSVPSPWGNNNRDLVTMYRNAQAGECPLVVDKTTPSCGNSRFGCWTCTVVERDRSMEAMIDSGEDWMQPLLDFRDWLASTQEPATKQEYREMRRRDGRIRTWGENDSKIIWGPYKMTVRREILRRLLTIQKQVRATGPDKNVHLIGEDELHEIRRLWRSDEGDWEDSIPALYEEVLGERLDWVEEDAAASTALDKTILDSVCAEQDVPVDLLRALVDVERELQGLGRRTRVYDKLGRVIEKDWRTNEQVFAEMPQAEDEELDAN
jgi:DNA sulfur modification protein DndC